MPTLTAYASSFNNAIPTGFTAQLATQSSAVGATEGDVATGGAIASGQIAGNHFFFADLAALPTNATLNSVTLEVRSRITSTARGNYAYRVDSAANTQLATEWVPTQDTALTVRSNATWSTTPTVAQLRASTFGVRARYSRTASQAVTYELDWLRIVVDYSVPNQDAFASLTTSPALATQTNTTQAAALTATADLATQLIPGGTQFPHADDATLTVTPALGMRVNRAQSATLTLTPDLQTLFVPPGGAADTELRVTLPTPSRALRMGADLQEFVTHVRKNGTGTDPQLRVEVLETGSNTVLATPIPDTPISSTTGVDVSGKWDASVLTNASGASVEARVIGTASATACLDVRANPPVIWNAGEETGALVLQKALNAILTASGALARTVRSARPVALNLTAALIASRMLLATIAVVLSMSAAVTKRTAIRLTRTLTLAANQAATKVATFAINATLTVTAASTRAARTARSATLSVAASLLRRTNTTLGTALSATASLSRRVLATRPVALAVTVSHAAIKVGTKAVNVTLTLAAFSSRAVRATYAGTLTLAPNLAKRAAHAINATLGVGGALLKRVNITQFKVLTLTVTQSAIKVFLKALNATLTLIPFVKRDVRTTLLRTLSLAPVVASRATKALFTTLLVVSATLKRANKPISALVALTAIEAHTRRFTQTLAANLSVTATVQRLRLAYATLAVSLILEASVVVEATLLGLVFDLPPEQLGRALAESKIGDALPEKRIAYVVDSEARIAAALEENRIGAAREENRIARGLR